MMRKTFSSGFGDGDCGSEDYSCDDNDDDIDKDLSAGRSKQLHFEVVLSAILKVIIVTLTMSIILIGDYQRYLNYELDEIFVFKIMLMKPLQQRESQSWG